MYGIRKKGSSGRRFEFTGDTPESIAESLASRLVDLLDPPTQKLRFKNPAHDPNPYEDDGLFTTIRAGNKYASLLPGADVALAYDNGETFALARVKMLFVGTLGLIIEQGLYSSQHDEATRTEEGLRAALAEAYGDVADDDVCVLIAYDDLRYVEDEPKTDREIDAEAEIRGDLPTRDGAQAYDTFGAAE